MQVQQHKCSALLLETTKYFSVLQTSLTLWQADWFNSHPAGSYFSWHMKSLLSHGDRLPSLGWLCYLQTRTSGIVIIVLFIDVSSLKQYPLASKWLFQNMVMSPWGFSRAESSRSPIWLHTPSDLVGLWAACWSLLSADLHSAHSVAVLVVWKPALFTLGLLIIIM